MIRPIDHPLRDEADVMRALRQTDWPPRTTVNVQFDVASPRFSLEIFFGAQSIVSVHTVGVTTGRQLREAAFADLFSCGYGLIDDRKFVIAPSAN